MQAGLYVHVPFCERRCGYCDFYAMVSTESVQDKTISAVLSEADLRRQDWSDTEFDTVYVGGGTPSHLGGERLTTLLTGLSQRLTVSSEAEWTLEANPESIDSELLNAALRAGVNRLSLGIQSFDDSELRLLGRLHNAETARQSVRLARDAGFKNLNVDLIYGLPEQPNGDRWAKTVASALELEPDHLSCYLLTLEPDVPMARSAAQGEIRLADDERCRDEYDLARRLLGDAGLEHYEISNWSRQEMCCRHNVNVWKGGDYLGLGPGAHAHRDRRRWANRPQLDGYVDALEAGRLPPRDAELVTETGRLEERILLGLRMREGVSWKLLEREGDSEQLEKLRERVSLMTSKGLMEETAGRIQITDEGLFVSNAVIAELIEVL